MVTMGKLLDQVDQPSVEQWFNSLDMPLGDYLKNHYYRFSETHKFVSETLPANSTILDIGAHWLHQALFFANDGHKLICADVPITINTEPVRRAAASMGADLIAYERLDQRTAFDAVPDNSVDGVLFFEIIEHITYNPIRMWEQIYRVLKPGGHIYVSTPNSMWFLRLIQKLEGIFFGV
jgi:2-polyprenyl-6-hydroxyphenyl methylase/3-demethylubiquinone-9 3-methyltransferase